MKKCLLFLAITVALIGASATSLKLDESITLNLGRGKINLNDNRSNIARSWKFRCLEIPLWHGSKILRLYNFRVGQMGRYYREKRIS